MSIFKKKKKKKKYKLIKKKKKKKKKKKRSFIFFHEKKNYQLLQNISCSIKRAINLFIIFFTISYSYF